MTKLCLCMIVKDEAAVIRRCLDSVRPHVQAWCIVDTGSTDGTQELVCDAMVGIPGVLHERPWVDFAANRTEALDLARGLVGPKGWDDSEEWQGPWYFLIIDADETLEVTDPIPELNLDGYHVAVDLNGVRFTRTLLLRADYPWRYEGVVHEDVISDQPYRMGPPLPGLLVRSTRDGARAKDKTRYQRDAALLKAEWDRLTLAGGEWDENHKAKIARTAFYLANSLRDGGDNAAAVGWYETRAHMSGWDQETWAACHEKACCLARLGKPPIEVIEAFLMAYNNRPSRAETLVDLAIYLRHMGLPTLAALFDAHAKTLPLSTDIAFVCAKAYRRQDRIAIITAPRPPGAMHPIGATINALLASDVISPMSLRVFGDCLKVPEPWGPIPFISTTQEQLDLVKEGGRFGTLNLCRALEWSAADGDAAVVLEDDVLFSRGWLERATHLLELAETVYGDVVLSLHHMHASLDVFDPTGLRCGEDALWQMSERTWPNGSQGTMARPAVAKRLAARLREWMALPTADERKEGAMDCGVLRFCREERVPLLYAEPTLLWHQPVASTWWEGRDPRCGATKRFRPW